MLKATILPNNELTVVESPVSHGVKFEGIEFSFPESWQGFSKTAVFSSGEDLILSVVLDPQNSLCFGVDKCYIPAEILEKEEFSLSVYGVSGESRATSTRVTIGIRPSGYALGDTPADPTPTEYEQIINLVEEIKESAENGTLGGKGDKGDKGDAGDPGVYYGTTAPVADSHPVWINPEGEGYEIDHIYNATSENPQSGKAVAMGLGALETSLSAVEANVDGLGEQVEQAQITIGQINSTISGLLNVFYPMGSIYQSTLSTSPSTLFGGTWERIKDVFLLSSGDIYSAGATGGEANHTLTVDEMPKHNHTVPHPNGTAPYYVSPVGTTLPNGADTNKSWGQEMFYTKDAGNNAPHNNMPPYLAVYMWKRTG